MGAPPTALARSRPILLDAPNARASEITSRIVVGVPKGQSARRYSWRLVQCRPALLAPHAEVTKSVPTFLSTHRAARTRSVDEAERYPRASTQGDREERPRTTEP